MALWISSTFSRSQNAKQVIYKLKGKKYKTKQKTSPYNFCKAIVWSHFNTVFSSDNPVLPHHNNIEKVKPHRSRCREKWAMVIQYTECNVTEQIKIIHLESFLQSGNIIYKKRNRQHLFYISHTTRKHMHKVQKNRLKTKFCTTQSHLVLTATAFCWGQNCNCFQKQHWWKK